jgi:hypothetical protein
MRYSRLWALVLAAACNRPEAPTRPPEVTLTGVWQDFPDVASGWGNAFQFYEDGRFTFHYSQMDCAKRIVSVSGHWTASDTLLFLIVDKRQALQGGSFETAMGSCATEWDLEDAQDTTIAMSLPDTNRMLFVPPDSVSVLIYDSRQNKKVEQKRLSIAINGRRWYQMATNPADYR